MHTVNGSICILKAANCFKKCIKDLDVDTKKYYFNIGGSSTCQIAAITLKCFNELNFLYKKMNNFIEAKFLY